MQKRVYQLLHTKTIKKSTSKNCHFLYFAIPFTIHLTRGEGYGISHISQASRASGKDRNTIKRYLKTGRLSGTIDESGKVVIDAAGWCASLVL